MYSQYKDFFLKSEISWAVQKENAKIVSELKVHCQL